MDTSEKKIVIDYLMVRKERGDQGVHSASLEDIDLVQRYGTETFEALVCRGLKRADIVHVCDIHPQFYPKLKRGRVSVAMCHFLPETLDGSIALPKGIMKLFKSYVMAFYRRADHLVTVNPVYVDQLVKLGFDPKRVHYIPNCVSTETFHPLSIKEKLRARHEFNLKNNDFVVLSVGQTQPRKGLYDFIELAEDNPDVQFIWAGGFTFGRLTAEHRKIKRAIQKCPPNLHFIGVVERSRMNELYNACDMYVSVSYNELFPMTILEAASVGLPILVRDLDLYEPILGRDVLRATDISEFSATIKRMHGADASLRSSFSLASQALAQRYAPELVYQQWEKLYREILLDAPRSAKRCR